MKKNEAKMQSVLRKAGEEPGVLYCPIGGTVFKVRVIFSEDATERMEDKILRMMQSEEPVQSSVDRRIPDKKNKSAAHRDFAIRDFIIFLSRDPEIYVIMEAPQTDRLPEGSASCA